MKLSEAEKFLEKQASERTSTMLDSDVDNGCYIQYNNGFGSCRIRFPILILLTLMIAVTFFILICFNLGTHGDEIKHRSILSSKQAQGYSPIQHRPLKADKVQKTIGKEKSGNTSARGHLQMQHLPSKKDEVKKTRIGKEKSSNSSVIQVALLIPSVISADMENPFVEMSFFQKVLPSYIETIEESYNYTMYIVYDEGSRWDNLINDVRSIAQKRNNLYIKGVVVPKKNKGSNFVEAVNLGARAIFADYIFRSNDDSFMTSNNWTSKAIASLQNMDPPNIGVVGPTHAGGKQKPGFLSHDFVSRTHFEIFGFYYPPVFKNWYSDDWISQVYAPDRFKKLSDWTVTHAEAHRRYKIYDGSEFLGPAVKQGKSTIEVFLQKADVTTGHI